MNIEEARNETAFRQGFHPWLWMLAILSGSIMFFYLGWVYQASWYWYYGIDIARLNVPLPVILQQSWILSTIILGVLLALFGILFLLRLIVLCARSLFLRERRIELASLFSIYDIFRRNFHVVVLVYLALLHEFLVGISTHNEDYFTLEMPAAVTTLDTLIIPIAFVLSIRLLGDFLSLLPTRLKDRLRLAAESGIHDEPYRILLGVLALFVASVLFTGVMAVGDASVGFRENASYQAVRRVYLESDLPIAGLDLYRQGCDCSSPYVYGPMGYLGNNEEYLFLIPWKADGEEDFPQFPRLYQIERSRTNTINIIPYGAGTTPAASPPETEPKYDTSRPREDG